jgi:hypothetical protein
VLDEEVPAAALEVGVPAKVVGLIREDQQVEVLVRLDQRVHELQRGRYGHVLIYVAGGEQQLALEL